MLRLSKILVTISFLFSMFILPAQSVLSTYSGLPIKICDSPLFGKDVIIQNQPDQNQMRISVCNAFNGWLYAVISYFKDGVGSFFVSRSTDNGVTWNVLYEEPVTADVIFTKVEILACGNDLSTLKIFIGLCGRLAYDEAGGAWLLRWNGEPFEFEENILSDDNGRFTDISVATDFLSPSINANPYSIGILYAKTKIAPQSKDSIIFRSSSNGGLSLDTRRVVAITPDYTNKVSISFGKSPSWGSGRYYATWETMESKTSSTGHILTSHTTSNFNSPFTPSVYLDSLNSSYINLCHNPKISTQINSLDNDSANITQVVFFERMNNTSNLSEIIGCSNLQSTTSNYFKSFSCTNSSHYNYQPDICFNPMENNFLLTYYDSTSKKLPLLSKNINIQDPSTWTTVSTGFNDSSNLELPFPRVIYNNIEQSVMNVWLAEGQNTNGVAMFDALYSTWTGIPENTNIGGPDLINAYPIPCKDELNITFELKKAEKVTINVLSIFGQPLVTVTNQYYTEGKHIVKFNVSRFSAGTYLYNFNLGDCKTVTGKFSIIK